MLFISSSKHFSFLRYLCFLPDFFGFAGKRLDKKAKVILKIYDALKWNTHNYNKQKKQSGNETWSVCRI